MEFEQYLESDILTFLDSKILKKENTSKDREEEYGLYLTKDYLKELNYALDNDELTRAKKLFDELKENYSRLPKSSVERKKIYSLLERMYDKIQNYVRIKEGKIEIIKQGDIEVFKDTTEKFSSIADRMEKAATASPAPSPDNVIKSTLIKRTELPIKSSISRELKTNTAEDNMLLEHKLAQHQNAIAVENNLSNSSIKDEVEKPLTIDKIEKIISEKSIRTIGEREKEIIDQIKFPNIATTGKNIAQDHRNNVEKQTEKQNYNHKRQEDLKEEIITKTNAHLEKVKMHVTDKLLEELRKKLDDNNHEQLKKIESLRQDIVKQVIEELDKKLKKEKSDVSHKIENLREDILNKVYHQAQQIISSRDNYEYPILEQDVVHKENNIKIKNHNEIESIKPRTVSIEPLEIERSDVIKYTLENDQAEAEENSDQNNSNNYSGEDLRVVYEQAIYYMFDNKYNEAAKLFRKIITIQPGHKAAKIRLQECFDKQPELLKEKNIPTDSEIQSIIETTNTITEPRELEENIGEINYLQTNTYTNFENIEDNFTRDKDTFTDNYNTISTEDVEHVNEDNKEVNLSKHDIKHKHTKEELEGMYKKATYNLFQGKYIEAVKMFEEIIRIQPNYKAAKIRLQECLDKQPELSNLSNKNNITTEIEEKNNTEINYSNYTPTDASDEYPEIEKSISEDIERLEKEEIKHQEKYTENIKLQKTNIKHKYNDEELQKMYEEAIYIMFQNNYSEAAEILQQILRIRPENKAARIRLQECRGASGNA